MGSPDPTQDLTIEDVRGFFSHTDHLSTPFFTGEIAEALECSRDTARRYLTELAERGEIQTKQQDDSRSVWWTNDRSLPSDHQPNEVQLSAFVSAVKDYAIFMLDPDGRIISWNQGAERIKGYSEDEIVGEHFSTFYTEDDVADGVPERNLETAAAEGRVEDEGWRVREDGSRFWANVTITAIRDDEGGLLGFTKVTRDMTERREYEQQLEEQAELLERQRDELEQEFNDIFDHIDEAFLTLDTDWTITYVNDRTTELVRLPTEELVDSRVWDVLPEVAEGRPRDLAEAAMRRQESVEFEFYSELLDIWIEVRGYASEEGMSVYFRDISDRKARERELDRALDLLEKAERIADVGGWEIDTDTEEVFWTEHLFEILEVPYDEEPPLDEALDVYHEEDRSIVESAVEEALAAGESFDVEVRFRTPSGEVRWLHVEGEPEVEDGDVVSLRGAVQDVTERKERERELQRVRERMEFALNATDAVVWDWNVDDDQASFYPSAESLYGRPVENWDDFIEVIHPEDRQKVQEAIEGALETGEPKHEEIRIIRDGEVRWIEAPGHPVQDDDGPTRMIGVARDITQRKTFERKLMESNERLEQFAYVASHDLQEPLRMVSSYLQLLEDRYADEFDEEAEEFIEFAIDGADRMREMIDDLLDYSRIDTEAAPLEPTDAEAVLEDVLRSLELQIEENNAEVDVGSLPTVHADRNQLEQVFQNLLSNAIKYQGEEPPRIDISAERNGAEWVFHVADNGIGMEPEQTDRIFEVFDRLHTHDEYPGTGIGLALCRKIIERHGGRIWVESEPGEGSTFYFTLPTTEVDRQPT